jgi:acetyl-CoA C-acetyltransferase
MRSAVIVSTARTPIGRAYRGAFNNTASPTLSAMSIRAAVERAGIDGAEVDDVCWGSALQQGSQAGNTARTSLLRAGLPVTVPGMTIDRQCSSGLMAIATAAKQIVCDGMDITIGGGVESISLVQTPEMRVAPDRDLIAMHENIYMPMQKLSPRVTKSLATPRTNMATNRRCAPLLPKPPGSLTMKSLPVLRRWPSLTKKPRKSVTKK